MGLKDFLPVPNTNNKPLLRNARAKALSEGSFIFLLFLAVLPAHSSDSVMIIDFLFIPKPTIIPERSTGFGTREVGLKHSSTLH